MIIVILINIRTYNTTQVYSQFLGKGQGMHMQKGSLVKRKINLASPCALTLFIVYDTLSHIHIWWVRWTQINKLAHCDTASGKKPSSDATKVVDTENE